MQGPKPGEKVGFVNSENEIEEAEVIGPWAGHSEENPCYDVRLADGRVSYGCRASLDVGGPGTIHPFGAKRPEPADDQEPPKNETPTA